MKKSLTNDSKENYSHPSQEERAAMYVCLCAQVTEAQWAQALSQARSEGKGWREASTETGAGLGCGGCRMFLAQISAETVPLPILNPLPAAG